MISIVNQKSVSDGRIYADVFGTSQDTKISVWIHLAFRQLIYVVEKSH